MRTLESYQRPAFLNDHPPVVVRLQLTGTPGATLPAASVLGRDTAGQLGLWEKGREVTGILAAEVTVPESGTALVDVYIHAHVEAGALIFGEDVAIGDQLAALAALRLVGIYSSVTWAGPASVAE